MSSSWGTSSSLKSNFGQLDRNSLHAAGHKRETSDMALPCMGRLCQLHAKEGNKKTAALVDPLSLHGHCTMWWCLHHCALCRT